MTGAIETWDEWDATDTPRLARARRWSFFLDGVLLGAIGILMPGLSGAGLVMISGVILAFHAYMSLPRCF